MKPGDLVCVRSLTKVMRDVESGKVVRSESWKPPPKHDFVVLLLGHVGFTQDDFEAEDVLRSMGWVYSGDMKAP